MFQIVFVFVLLSSGLVTGSGVCNLTEYRNNKRCCSNFKYHEGICTPCIGTFGINCSGGTCPDGFYGFGCSGKCSCSAHQQCDRIKGCVEKHALCSETNWSVRMVPILLGIILGGSTVLVTAVVYFLKSLKSYKAENYVEDFFLPREYDQPNLVHVLAQFMGVKRNIQESNLNQQYTNQNVKSDAHHEDPHTYIECV